MEIHASPPQAQRSGGLLRGRGYVSDHISDTEVAHSRGFVVSYTWVKRKLSVELHEPARQTYRMPCIRSPLMARLQGCDSFGRGYLSRVLAELWTAWNTVSQLVRMTLAGVLPNRRAVPRRRGVISMVSTPRRRARRAAESLGYTVTPTSVHDDEWSLQTIARSAVKHPTRGKISPVHTALVVRTISVIPGRPRYHSFTWRALLLNCTAAVDIATSLF